VLRGESLWSIAAAELGPGVSDSAIAARWPHWYAANRAVIGPDPDVLLPGQVLQSPASLDRPVPQTPQEK
jgi:nucleoid-associated protein YgaU